MPKLPTLALPVVLNSPDVVKLPPVILPVAVINPTVPKLPTLALPDTDKLVSIPTLVILGCALVTTVPDVVAFPETLPIILATTVPEIITEVALALIV